MPQMHATDIGAMRHVKYFFAGQEHTVRLQVRDPIKKRAMTFLILQVYSGIERNGSPLRYRYTPVKDSSPVPPSCLEVK